MSKCTTSSKMSETTNIDLGSESSESDDDFESLFTVSKKTVLEKLKIKEILVQEVPCNSVDLTASAPSSEKKSRVAVPIPTTELPTIIIPDECFVQPARGRGRGRGRRRGRASRRSKGFGCADEELPPEFVSDPSRELNWSLDDSVKDVSIDLEEDNYEISVKVCWKAKTVTTFTIRKYQKLSSIFEFYAKQEGITQSQLRLMLGDRIVSPDDSPDSLSLTVANILEGGIITSATTNATAGAPNISTSPVDEDSIQLKVRSKESKQPVLIRIKKTQKMSVLMTKYAEQCEIAIEKLKFSFDGDQINPGDTPEDLDLEGDEMIDLVIAN